MFWPRRQRRPLAWFALYACLCGWMLPMFEAHPMGTQDDAACQLTSAWESAVHPHIGADAPAQGQPEHCVYCHLQRAMAGAATAHPAALWAPAQSTIVLGSGESATLAAVIPARPSRAPPAFASI